MSKLRFAAFLIVWLAATIVAIVTQSAASDWLINSYRFGAPPNPTLSFVGNTFDATNASSHTFTAASTGTAGNRTTVVVACGDDSGTTNFSTSSITIDPDGAGGAAPVSMAEQADTANASAAPQCSLYSASNPTNTTATFVVTWSEPINNAVLSVWAVYDLNSITATDFATGFHASSSQFSVDTDVQADGIVIGGGTTYGGSNDVWGGLTERTHAVSADTLLSANPADGTTTVAQTPRTITYDSGSSNNPAVAVVAAFR